MPTNNGCHTKLEGLANDKEVRKVAVTMFRNSCNRLADLVNAKLFDGSRNWYWIADEIGGTCDFEEADSLSPDEMARILEADMSHEDYVEWREANLANDRYINLKSWLLGARHDMFKEETNTFE